MNDRSFEDCERVLEDIKYLFSILCIFGQIFFFVFFFVSHLVISYKDFLVLFAPAS
jgi:hypothetical protein